MRKFRKKRTGLGSVLMASANVMVREMETCGVLLCHDGLIDFYKKAGWKICRMMGVTVDRETYDHNVMLYDPLRILPDEVHSMEIDRNF